MHITEKYLQVLPALLVELSRMTNTRYSRQVQTTHFIKRKIWSMQITQKWKRDARIKHLTAVDVLKEVRKGNKWSKKN